MEHGSDRPIKCAWNINFYRANQWNIGKTHLTAGSSWKGGIQIHR
jgi:hypothetical protein